MVAAGLVTRAGIAHVVEVLALGVPVVALWSFARAREVWARAYDRERRGREEMEAYARLDTRLARDGDIRGLAERVCGVVASRSPFCRVAMLARDADGRLYVAARVGMALETVAAVETWAAGVVERERGGERGLAGQMQLGAMRLGAASVVIALPDAAGECRGGMRGFVPAGESEGVTADDAGGVVSSPLAIAVPLWTSAGRMVGALVVCASNVRHAPRREAEEAVAALEALAVRLGRAMENAELANRSLRAEKLASLGLLAGGIAHELSNPLVSVMGYGELIGAAAEEERVRGDATKIVEQAQRMRDIVENLVNFWRPPVWREEPVDMRALVRRLGEECQGNLAARGIMLEVRAAEDTPMLRGNEHRLRVVLEHLMNNAAQAIAAARSQVGDFRGEAAGDEKKVERREAIRLTVSYDPRAVHVIVSDTGAGFREPERVFDLFYTTQAPGEGSGLGLSICYGIVREHQGEINAFNLHPAGAAVVVELPYGEVIHGQPALLERQGVGNRQ